MKILILDGSPHPKGTTSLLRKAFEEGAREAGHTVTTFHTAREEIHPCIGCDHCKTAPSGCIYQDGMEKLNPLLLEADCVVFSTPLYYFGMSTHIKAAVDRFYANNASLRSQKKGAVLLAACADKDDWALDALDTHFDFVCRYLHWDNLGRVDAIGMRTADDIEGTVYLDEARALGLTLTGRS